MDSSLVNQPFKLPHPVSGFTFFAEDQVLTADHLNEMIHYFNYQERKTRAWLIGTGIVCGLTVSIEKNAVHVTPGCGLTSDGDLFCFTEGKSFTKIAKFVDGEAKYPFFKDTEDLIEMLPEDAKNEEALAFTEEQFKDRIAVLYLESYVKEPDFCTTENCDNQGMIQHNHLRLLLVPRGKTIAAPKTLPELAIGFDELYATRPEIQNGKIDKLEDSGGKSGLQSRFTNAIEQTRKDFISAIERVKKNEAALTRIVRPIGFDWAGKLPSVSDPSKEIPDLQNIYAFYADMCQAYREWRDALLQLTNVCIPQLDAHPKHLLVGDPLANPYQDEFRHRFIPASTFASHTQGLRRAQLLWQRLQDLTVAFDASHPSSAALKSIKILPSRDPGKPLGQRALPAYYGAVYSGLWNVDHAIYGSVERPISYANTPKSIFKTVDWATDFYKIEGHIGKTLNDAEKQLKELRRTHNLSFEILAIQIEDDPTFVTPRRVRFFDLETAYHSHRTKLKLQLRDVDDFTNRLGNSLAAGQSRLPASDLQTLTETQRVAGQVNEKARMAKNLLPNKMSQLTNTLAADFSSSYTGAIRESHIVNKNIGNIAQQVQLNPIDRFVQPELSANWKLWLDRLDKRRKKVAELSTFEKFLDANNGLEHLGGVPRGGTFILVYSASQNEAQRIVKADFCLPYFSSFDLNSLEEEEEPVEPETSTPLVPFTPPLWHTISDWKVADLTEIEFDRRINTKTATIRTDLVSSLDLKIQDNFKTFEFFAGNFGKNLAGVGLGDIADLPNSGTAAGGRDVKIESIKEEMAFNKQRLTKLQQQKFAKPGSPEIDKQIEEIETRTVELIKQGVDHAASEVVKATQGNNNVSTTYFQFVDQAAEFSNNFTTDSGRTAMDLAKTNLQDTHAGVPVIGQKIGAFGKF